MGGPLVMDVMLFHVAVKVVCFVGAGPCVYPLVFPVKNQFDGQEISKFYGYGSIMNAY
jgi:hypothetical protein